MSGFGFGSGNVGANPFGSSKPNQPASGFGGNTAAPGSLFGGLSSQSPAGTLAFGQPSTMTSGLSFGASAPQTNTGLSFGGSSLGQTGGVSFGNPPTSTGRPTGLFGTTASQPSGLSFGQTTNQLSFGGVGAGQSNLTFGQPTATTALAGGISFGSTPAQSTGVSFGGTTLSSVAPSGLTFGTPAATVALGSGFGTAASTASTGFAFGSTAQTAPTLGLGGGTAPSGLTGLGFGTASTTPSLTFGSSSATSATGISFGATPTSTSLGFQGLTAAASTAAKPLTLSFGSTPATSSGGLTFALPPASTQATGFGLGGAATSTGLFSSLTSKPLALPTSAATSLSFGTFSQPTTTATPSVGLGGVDTSLSKAGATGSGSGRTDKAVKENQIPNEIIQTIDEFKNFVKAQKGLSSDIARSSIKPLDKVREDTEALKQMLATIANGLQRNRAQADHLKTETATDIRHAEMAQRTHDTPPGLQYDNVAPLQYFADLAASFEQQMHAFRQEIEKTEKHIQSLMEPKPLTPQELSMAMRRLHDSFVALAGRLQTVHNQVATQKDQYLNVRKYFLKDPTNVFEDAKKHVGITERPLMESRIPLGPTPFSSMGCQQGYGLLQSMSQESKSPFPSGNPLGWNGVPSQQTSLSSSFLMGGMGPVNNSLLLPSNPVENQSFLLQKPPPGTKRGKR